MIHRLGVLLLITSLAMILIGANASQETQSSNLRVESISPTVIGRDGTVEITIAYDGEAAINRPTVRINDVHAPRNSLNVQITSVGTNLWRATAKGENKSTIYNVFVRAQTPEGQAITIGIEPVDELPNNRPDGVIDGFFDANGIISDDAIFFESDISLPPPYINPQDGNLHAFSSPFPIIIDFGVRPPGEPVHEVREYAGDTHNRVMLTIANLDGFDMVSNAATVDGHKWRLLVPNIEAGEHTLTINARDEAGNTLANNAVVTFTVLSRPAFPINLIPGWNLISFPRELEDSSIDAVFRPNAPVTTVFQFDPTVVGGWRVAFREQVADPLIFGPFVGDLRTVDAQHGYWAYSLSNTQMGVFLSDSSSGGLGGVPIIPREIEVHEGWNLVPVFDATSRLGPGDVIDADIYFASVRDEVARILSYDPINSQWSSVVGNGVLETGTQAQLTIPGTPGACATCPLDQSERVEIGRAYWVFAIESASLIP